jgi:hypothetical protein
MYNQQHNTFYVGEVISYTDSYEYNESNVNTQFAINVAVKIDGKRLDIAQAIPASIHVKQLPVIGEMVIVLPGYSVESAYQNDKLTTQWYYISGIGSQSNVNNNINPVFSKSFIPDTKFIDTPVNFIQPYLGDVIVEGRWGNSIRLSHTPISTKNQPIWNSVIKSDPVIVISNSKPISETNGFRTEQLGNSSTLILTSTQQVPTLLFGNTQQPNSLSKYKSESTYDKPQLLGTADRVVIKANTDIVAIDSPTAIVLNTTGEVKIGSDTASSEMVHGDVLIQILQKILNQLSMPILCGTALGQFADRTNLQAAQQQLKDLLSSTYFIQKNTY